MSLTKLSPNGVMGSRHSFSPKQEATPDTYTIIYDLCPRSRSYELAPKDRQYVLDESQKMYELNPKDQTYTLPVKSRIWEVKPRPQNTCGKE